MGCRMSDKSIYEIVYRTENGEGVFCLMARSAEDARKHFESEYDKGYVVVEVRERGE